MPAILLLNACKNDQSVNRRQAQAEAQHDSQAGNRAVFGPPLERTPENHSPAARPREPQSHAQSTPSRPNPDLPQQRSRTQTAQEQQSSSLTELSQSAAGGRSERSVAVLPGAQQQGSLRHQPPSLAVSDPGELSTLARQPRTEVLSSASVEPVRLLVRRWADTLLKGDIAQHMALYAQTLDRFHGRPNVSRDAVRSEKQRLLSQLAGLGRLEMTDILLHPAADGSVVVSFRVEADARTPALIGPYRLAWRHSGGDWKIYSEERPPQSISRTR
jgi:DNA polymerase III gamma/tau subunit